MIALAGSRNRQVSHMGFVQIAGGGETWRFDCQNLRMLDWVAHAVATVAV